MGRQPAKSRRRRRQIATARLITLPALVFALLGAGSLAWAAKSLFERGEPWLATASALAGLGLLAGIFSLRLLIDWFLVRPLAGIVGVIDACAINLRAARCKPQRTADVSSIAEAVDRMLDRSVRIETNSRAIIQSARDSIITVNHRGIIQSFNPAAEAMFGYPAAAAIGRNVGMLMPEPHSKKHDEYLARYLETGIAKVLGFTRDDVAVRADGTTFPISIYVCRIDQGDGFPLFCGILRDVTEQQRADREMMMHALRIEQANMQLAQAKFEAEEARALAESANSSKSEFLANMSHEIRTPMTAILGFAETLQDPALTAAERQEAVETILRNGDHLMTLINDILDLSKIEAGRLVVEQLQFSPVDLLAEVASLMRVRASSKGLELLVDYKCPLPAFASSDPTRLRQILMNLCGNAIKFTAAGSVTLALRFLREADGRRVLRFEVRDTGIGMSPEQLKRLFRPFEQADSSTTRRFGGTGLGLSISKRLVEKLGGEVGVTSEPGKGSTFWFTIDPGPLVAVPLLNDVSETIAARKREVQPDAKAPPPRLDGRILLAEDGTDNQRLITFLLQKAGATVTVVGDGQAAVEAVHAAETGPAPFDLVLMDMQMPIKDGYEAASELRSTGFRKPIVALTANAMAGDRERCLQAGCTDFAPKPVDRKALLETLDRLLRPWRAKA